MKTRILLVNFTLSDARKTEVPNVSIERGYISDVLGYTPIDEGKKIENVILYLPHPAYEYNSIFINLNTNIELDKEFKDKARPVGRDAITDFYQFWTEKGMMIVFLGNYKYSNLNNIGVFSTTLADVNKSDITCLSSLDDTSSFRKTLKDLITNIPMPTHKYILLDTEKLKVLNRDASARIIYRNRGDDVLGYYYSRVPEYYSEDSPYYLILPQFRNNSDVVQILLKELAKIYNKLLPEFYQADWVDNEKYYPNEICFFDTEIDKLLGSVKTKIDELYEAKKNAKSRFSYVRGLLYCSGNELKANVIKVLNDVFKIKTVDADDKVDGDLNEDILIDLGNERIILAEVKGVVSQNPSPSFIGQVWKHIARKKDKSITEGALILNYDVRSDPDERSIAYTGEYEKDLEDIIFIDTRVMFYLAIAIIDYGLSAEEASKRLFQRGRVQFDITTYLKEKENQNTDTVSQDDYSSQ